MGLMSSVSTADIYNNGTYLNNNNSWHEEDAPIKADKIITLLKGTNLKFNTVCEVGCGSGEILVCLSKQMADNIVFHGLMDKNVPKNG